MTGRESDPSVNDLMLIRDLCEIALGIAQDIQEGRISSDAAVPDGLVENFSRMLEGYSTEERKGLTCCIQKIMEEDPRDRSGNQLLELVSLGISAYKFGTDLPTDEGKEKK